MDILTKEQVEFLDKASACLKELSFMLIHDTAYEAMRFVDAAIAALRGIDLVLERNNEEGHPLR